MSCATASEVRRVTVKSALNIIKQTVDSCVPEYRFHLSRTHVTHEQTCIPHVGLRCVLVTPFSAWHGWHIECTLTHNRNPLGSCGGSDPWSYSAYQSSIVQVLCHPRARVAGLREGVVGLSGGTVPRTACRIQLAWSLISSG
jgi:hypothetical protein